MIDRLSRGRRSPDKLLEAEFPGRTASAVRKQAWRRGCQLELNPWNQWLISQLVWLVETKFLSVALAAAMLREYVDGLPTDVGFRQFISRRNRRPGHEKKIRASVSYPGLCRHLHIRSKPGFLRLFLLNEHFKLEWMALAAASSDDETVAEEHKQLRRILDLDDDSSLAEAVGRLNPGGDRVAWTGWAQMQMAKHAVPPANGSNRVGTSAQEKVPAAQVRRT